MTGHEPLALQTVILGGRRYYHYPCTCGKPIRWQPDKTMAEYQHTFHSLGETLAAGAAALEQLTTIRTQQNKGEQ